MTIKSLLQKISIPVFLILTSIFAWPSTAFTQTIAPVDTSIVSLMVEKKIPGLSYAIVKNGDIIRQKSFGVSDLEQRTPESKHTAHYIASTTKIFTGMGVMRLVQNGKLDLDKSIAVYLPDIPEGWREVTVRQAISHTSGLPSILDENGDPLGGGTMDYAWEKVKQKSLTHEPGARWQYSQMGSEVIHRIANNITGQSWESFIEEQIFYTAGMNDTYFLWNLPADLKNQSTIYQVDDDAEDYSIANYDIVNEHDYYIPSATGIFTSSNDLAKFAMALQANKFLDKQALQEMWTSSDFQEKPVEWLKGYGIGWILGSYNGHRRVWHSGGGKAIFVHYPEENLSIMVLTNLADGGVLTFANMLSDEYLNY